jgi:hypothetical protein
VDGIAINARLGDGILLPRGKNVALEMQSVLLDWITVKRDMCLLKGFSPSHITMRTSGFTGRRDIYSFSTKVAPEITEVYNLPLEDILANLTKENLVMWYLDDGSYHVRRHTMHLYCNMLTDEQVNLLIAQFSALYGIAPRRREDRKKDGRRFPYLYFPRELVEAFRLDVKRFLLHHKIKSLFYKIGEAHPLRFTKVKEIS